MIKEFAPRDCNQVSSMCDVDETVVVIFIVIQIAFKVAMINPDICGGFDGNSIGLGWGWFELDIADDDPGLFLDLETSLVENYLS